MSIDEFAVLKHHKYAVIITDPERKVILDILPSRKKKDLITYQEAWSKEQLAKIKVFSMDMWKPYKAVADTMLPDAEVVNGFTEGVNNKIKLIKRIGYGVPNIMNLRRRVFHAMLHKILA